MNERAKGEKKNPRLNVRKKGELMGKRVDPIRDQIDIDRIKSGLEGRDLALFVVGINVALRAVDLLSIKVGQVKGLKPGEYFFLVERKTGKRRSVIINKASHKAIALYLEKRPGALDNEPLFPSRKGVRTPISRYRLNRLVQGWCKGIRGEFGSHSLRKTWGYHQRVRFRTDTPTLMRAFNHSSEAQTLTYLGITPGDVHKAFMNQI